MQVGGRSVEKFSSDYFYFLHEVRSKTASTVRRKEEEIEVERERS